MNDFPVLASLPAVRPVFLVVMGFFLALSAWRLSRSSSTWAARCLVAGGSLLGFGYGIFLPLAAAGVIPAFSSRAPLTEIPATVLAWQVVKLFAMNAGWLCFGLGLAIHANLLQPLAASPRRLFRRLPSPHESVA
jgi:uncharacterized membrane protein